MVFDDSERERFQFDRREFEPFTGDEDNDDNEAEMHPADRLAELLEFLIGDEG